MERRLRGGRIAGGTKKNEAETEERPR